LKVKYVADYLAIAYEWHEIDIMQQESRTEAFLALNPEGQVPVVDLGEGRVLSQSNAIIQFLAQGSSLLPADKFELACVNQWLFWEQYSHEPYIAVCRFVMEYQGESAAGRELWRVEKGESALDSMEQRLGSQTWLATQGMSVADVSLMAYTRVAHEGGFDLSNRPSIKRWIADCERELNIGVYDRYDGG